MKCKKFTCAPVSNVLVFEESKRSISKMEKTDYESLSENTCEMENTEMKIFTSLLHFPEFESIIFLLISFSALVLDI